MSVSPQQSGPPCGHLHLSLLPAFQQITHLFFTHLVASASSACLFFSLNFSAPPLRLDILCFIMFTIVAQPHRLSWRSAAVAQQPLLNLILIGQCSATTSRVLIISLAVSLAVRISFMRPIIKTHKPGIRLNSNKEII